MDKDWLPEQPTEQRSGPLAALDRDASSSQSAWRPASACPELSVPVSQPGLVSIVPPQSRQLPPLTSAQHHGELPSATSQAGLHWVHNPLFL